jgi:hypothetical protein
MASSVQAESIRHQVRRMFEQHGAPTDCDMCESLLIRDGFFCGRKFELDGMQAVWFVEEHEVKIHDRDGKVLASDDVGQLEHRNAA